MNMACICLAITLLYGELTILIDAHCLWFPGRAWITDPQFSEDGDYFAVITVRRADDMLYRTLMVFQARDWRPVKEIVLDQYYDVRNEQRPGLSEKRTAERARRCGFAWLARSKGRLLYFIPEGKLYTILVTDPHAKPELLWRERAIFRLSISPDGRYAAMIARSENHEGIVCVVLDIPMRRVIKEHPTSMPGAPYPVVAFSHDGCYLAVSDGELIDVLDLRTGKLIADGLADGDEFITALAFTPDNTALLALDFAGELRWWDWRKGKVLGSRLIQGLDDRAGIGLSHSDKESFIIVWNSSRITVYDLKRVKVVWSKPWNCAGCSLHLGASMLAIATGTDGMVFDRIMLVDSRTGELRRSKD